MIQEALAKGNKLPDNFDIWATRNTMKASYHKYFNQTTARVRRVLHSLRIETEPEEFDTKLPVEGIIENFEKNKSHAKQSFTTVKIETSWLEHQTKEYQELHATLAASSCCPSNSEELEAFKKFIYLDMAILLGADVPWRNPDARSAEEESTDQPRLNRAADGASGESTSTSDSECTQCRNAN